MLIKTGNCLDQNSENYLELTGGKRHAVRLEKSMPMSSTMVTIIFEDGSYKEATIKTKTIIPDYMWEEREKERKFNNLNKLINNFPEPSRIISKEEELDEVQINVEGFSKDIDLDDLANKVVKYMQFKTLYEELYELLKNNFQEQMPATSEKRVVEVASKSVKGSKLSRSASEMRKELEEAQAKMFKDTAYWHTKTLTFEANTHEQSNKSTNE